MPAQKVSSSQDEALLDVEAESFQYEDEITALNGPRKTEPKIVTVCIISVFFVSNLP